MGTSYSVKLIVDKPLSDKEERATADMIRTALQRIDSLMSTYRPDSEISRFNNMDIPGELKVASETLSVMLRAAEINRTTNGFFDVTVEPLVRLWGFGSVGFNGKLPSPEDLDRAMSAVGMSNILIDESRLMLGKRTPVSIDLSAIAKGYAVDVVAGKMHHSGYTNFMVEVGGEIFVSGRNLAGKEWVLGIEQPDFAGRKAYTVVALDGQAMATSGDYRNYYLKDGQKFSHTLDPRSGAPVRHQTASVSVVAKNCMDADALATALMAMGEAEGLRFAHEHQIAAFFIFRKDGNLVSSYSPEFARFLID